MAKKTKILIASLAVVAAFSAQAADDVLSRIKPVGQVNVAGQADKTEAASAKAHAAPAAKATAQATPPAKSAAAPKTAAAPRPAAAPAGGGNKGAALFAAKGCAGCHGADAKTKTPNFPKLAGQSAVYLLNQMKDIKSGARHNGQTAMMKPIIAGVSDAEMKAIADWLAALKP